MPGGDRCRTDGDDPASRQPTAPGSTTGDEWRRRLVAAVRRRFGIDARALAGFRIAVAALVVGDLAFRARSLQTFYTDAGVLPRSALAAEYPTLAALSLHALSGTVAVQAALFGATALIALALLVGYRTPLATVLTLGLVASMNARNPYVLNGGDGLLTVALLVALFLPLGARWSVDARRRAGDDAPTGDASPGREDPVGRNASGRVSSVATATLLVQPVAIYAANAGFKLRSPLWRQGEAIQVVLQLEQFAVGLAPYLTGHHRLLTALTWLWMALVVASPLLLVVTDWRRTVLVAAYAVVHVGMAATMRLGLFPLVSVAVLVPFLPPAVWDRLEGLLAGPARAATAFADDALAEPAPWRLPPWLARSAGRLGTVAVTVVLVASLLWPAAALGLPAVPTAAEQSAPDYTWNLFAPHPSTHHRWIVAPATLSTGERVDALDGSAVTWERPPDAGETYPNALWHRYVVDIRAGNVDDPRPLGAYLCRRGVPGRSAAIDTVAFYVLETPVRAVGGGERRRIEYVDRDCRR